MNIEELLRKHGEEGLPAGAYVERVVNTALRNSGYTLLDSKAVKGSDHYIIEISGGNNGNPQWARYFSVLEDIVSDLNERGWKVWLIELINDCPDDVHTAYFGIREIKKGKE